MLNKTNLILLAITSLLLTGCGQSKQDSPLLTFGEVFDATKKTCQYHPFTNEPQTYDPLTQDCVPAGPSPKCTDGTVRCNYKAPYAKGGFKDFTTCFHADGYTCSTTEGVIST